MKRFIGAAVVAVALSASAVKAESMIEILDEGHYEPGMCYHVYAKTASNVVIGEILTALEQFGNYWNDTTETWQIPNEDLGITPQEAPSYHHYTTVAIGQGVC